MLEMSDIVLLITDVRHPVSGPAGGGREISWGQGRGRSWETGILLPLQAPALC